MSASSDPSLPTAWPAARPTGISPIQHPSWEAARNAVLDLAAEGPVTAVIVGESGTGKTWLLRELASALGDGGFPSTMLMQGNLPMRLSAGAALLVDDAALMDDAARAELSTQEHGVVVLAAEEWPDAGLSPGPTVIRLRPLRRDEIADFAAEWLERVGLPAATIDAGALARQAAESGSTPRRIVQLLAAAVAMRAALQAGHEDEAPTAPVPTAAEPVAEPPVRLPPRRRAVIRPALALSAIAAAVVLGWVLRPAPPPPILADAAPTALPPVRQAETFPAPALAAPAALPPLRTADIPDPALVTASAPAQPKLSPPPLATPPVPEVHIATAAPALETPPSSPAIAAAAPPAPPAAEPTVVATLDEPAESPPPRRGGPGLVLVAQRGDTLESLYGSVYRDRNAPSYATVVAANPGPFRPGAIVIFPEPPGGWQRAQR